MLIAFVLLAMAVVAVLGFASTKPDVFRVSRRIRVQAPPERIQPLLVDFRRWAAWSPYDKLDPGMQKTFSGPPSGVGAAYAWSGNGKAGAGRMEITGVTPALVTIQLDFLKPFASHNTAEFACTPQPDGSTELTWTMHGPAHMVSKVMQLFIDLDRMVGRDFEVGLANLRRLAETPPQ